jgi:hypothetical protein
MSPKIKNPGGRSGEVCCEQHTIADPAKKNNCQSAMQFTVCEAASVDYGIVTLRLHIEAGRLVRYTVTKEQSFLAGGISKAPIKT